MHWCAAWEPVGQCFDEITFECINFHGLSQIIASLTRENIAEREAAVHNLPRAQNEKDTALAKCRLSLRDRVFKKPMLCLHAVTDEEASSMTKTSQAEDYALAGAVSLRARTDDERLYAYQTLLDYVQKDPEDIQWITDKQEFDEMMGHATAFGGVLGLGSRFPFNAYRFVVEGGWVSSRFAASRTVFIPKSSTVDDNGLL